ncbi:hypothetical protein HPC62_21150 [Thermoleptolyngbya sichuanensis A183]|uniref:Uncharacterized protein n=1 Tax=Thermoleptolyngbya sichuanensis A183 TaxID=2737172 RepID=A0A6M8BCE6_9CYAN|nr:MULTISPECIES: hypothetical protein [Thermoleptolyngbya]MDG2614668.1 hypothetical protein [Thermoleptolyngbya sichuanensis XZ-Cy5]QKD84348.1 hypothetical protein HPC62_21150 [Thermoleptolyngbya sichuanensis A183]
MVTTQVDHYYRQISLEEQTIYDHLLHWIEHETPEQMVDRFHALFIDGSRYSDPDIVAALDKVTASRLASEEFRYVLNRCCHILINRWQARSQSQLAIPKLIELFENNAAQAQSQISIHRSRSLRRLRELTRQFTETEQYLTLRRLAQVLSEAAEAQQGNGQRPLGTLIPRYPYLYEHCLISEDCTREQQNTVRQVRASRQHKFEVDLSQYLTYQVRQDRAAENAFVGAIATPSTPRLIHPVSNPTLLEDQDLNRVVRHYTGKIEGSRSYKDLAQNFLAQSNYTHCFADFKNDLYEYITSSVDPEYGRRQFNNQLYGYLKDIMPDSDDQRLNDFLLVRTCSHLLNFLVVDSAQHPKHFVFVDLLTNLGPMLTTGLLLKIVLLCRKVKPALERRFSILFSHYESCSRDAVSWLIEALENLNVALSVNFGSVDLSFLT